jgi:arginase family enzyme
MSPEYRAMLPPFPTFLGVPLMSTAAVRPGSVVISGAPWDTDIMPRFGARTGPNGIRAGSHHRGEFLRRAAGKDLIDADTGERFSSRLLERVSDVGDFTIYPTDLLKTQESIASGVAEVVERGGFSIMLGGDHYTSYPSALGWNRAVMAKSPNTRIGYIHLDGHLDFADYNPQLGTLNSGTNARRISELPGVSRSNMAWIGISCLTFADQMDEISGMGGRVFSAEDVHELGALEVARRAAEHAVQGCDVIYVTVDVDLVDPGYLPGTGAADPSGITPAHVRDMLRLIAEYPLGAMDIMEVSPRLDPSGRSESLAAEMALTVAIKRLAGKL